MDKYYDTGDAWHWSQYKWHQKQFESWIKKAAVLSIQKWHKRQARWHIKHVSISFLFTMTMKKHRRAIVNNILQSFRLVTDLNIHHPVATDTSANITFCNPVSPLLCVITNSLSFMMCP